LDAALKGEAPAPVPVEKAPEAEEKSEAPETNRLSS
jgi:hypothetical protein